MSKGAEARNQMLKEQEHILASIKFLDVYKTLFDLTFDHLSTRVQRALKFEIESVHTLNKAIIANKEAGCITHCEEETHKLLEILEGTIELATDENIERIIAGKYVAGCNPPMPESFPVIDEGNGFDISKPVFLTTLVEVISHVMIGMTINSPQYSTANHTVQLPEEFDRALLKGSSIFINLNNALISLTIPHSGYSLSKELRILESPPTLEKAARLPHEVNNYDDLPPLIIVSSQQNLMSTNLKFLESPDEQTIKLFDVNQGAPKPGYIWACLKFSKAKLVDSSLGCGGHARIYLGRDKENVVTLAYNRDMPHMEGFGIESRVTEHKSSNTKDPFLLTRRDTDFTPSREAVYPFKDLSDIAGLTAFVDAQIMKEATYSPIEEPELKLSGAEECKEYGD